MFEALLILLSICGITHLMRDNSGPFGILSKGRNFLMSIPSVGVFFYELFNCPFCTGCWSSLIVYFIYPHDYSIRTFILWILMGGMVSLLMEGVIHCLFKE